jgi:hypothetical protein
MFTLSSFTFSQSILSNEHFTKINEYTNNRIGFAVKDTPLWELSPNSSKDRSCDYCVIVLEGINPKITISILAKNLTYFEDRCNCESLKDLISYQYDLNFNSRDIVLINDNQTKLTNGISGWQMEYSSDEKKYYVLWFIMNGVFYEISFGAEPERYSKYLKEVKIEIDSFDFYSPVSKSVDIDDSLPKITNPSFKSNFSSFALPKTSESNFTMLQSIP